MHCEITIGLIPSCWGTTKYPQYKNLGRGCGLFTWRDDVFSVVMEQDTKQGKRINGMVERGVPEYKIDDAMTRYALAACTAKQFRDVIDYVKQRSYQEGLRDKAAEIKNALDI